MNIYWEVLIITAVLAVIFRKNRKWFIISTAAVHIFVCGFRYELMHGDLSVYKRDFLRFAEMDWYDEELFNEGRNTLFYYFNKLVANLTNNNFQALLFLIAFISILSISVIIYRYSEMPFVSFLMWNCFGFYMFSFYSIKQTLAMAIVMFAAIGIYEQNRKLFYSLVIIAGLIHVPAFVFLPSYEICRAKKMSTILIFYAISSCIVLLFRNQIVAWMADLYYEGDKYAAIESNLVGGKTFMIIALLFVGTILCNINYKKYRYAFIIMSAASLLQMFSVYDNVFTRLADYYFQFIILYASFILKQPHKNAKDVAALYFNTRSQQIITVIFMCLAVLFYYKVNLSGNNTVAVDDLIANFRFMWQ